MNDTELDQLLDTWHAPAAPRSLRDGLRARFPPAERPGFVRPLRWALAIAFASIALAVVTLAIGQAAQSVDSYGDLPVVRFVYRLYENFLQGREARRAERIVAKIRESEPKVYVDGRVISPLQFAPATTMDVLVPEEGVYSISLYRYMGLRTADGRPTGWVEAGHVHANMIEFQAGNKQVRIVCNQPIVDSDRPVFAMRR